MEEMQPLTGSAQEGQRGETASAPPALLVSHRGFRWLAQELGGEAGLSSGHVSALTLQV